MGLLLGGTKDAGKFGKVGQEGERLRESYALGLGISKAVLRRC